MRVKVEERDIEGEEGRRQGVMNGGRSRSIISRRADDS